MRQVEGRLCSGDPKKKGSSVGNTKSYFVCKYTCSVTRVSYNFFTSELLLLNCFNNNKK